MVDQSKVLLGFVDEPITDDYNNMIDYTTNKLGGLPDWIDGQSKCTVICKICASVTPLLLQIYAPIVEKSKYHRTLYIFACLNPSCWGNSKSWTCLKNQTAMKEKVPDAFSTNLLEAEDWLSDANNWDVDDKTDRSDSGAISFLLENEAALMLDRVTVYAEENANVISESCLEMKCVLPSAEIEPDENEPITVDTPTIPRFDLLSMLKKVPTSQKVYKRDSHFIPWFIYVIAEKVEKDPLFEHVQVLLTDYTKANGHNGFKISKNLNVLQQSDEKYEKSNPHHGDKFFHSFLSRIKANPDQIIRYCRSNRAPLFLYSQNHIPSKCTHCSGEMVFEMQILPTIINYLRLTNDHDEKYALEFGSAFVYTCKDSCDRSDEEELVVQLEKF